MKEKWEKFWDRTISVAFTIIGAALLMIFLWYVFTHLDGQGRRGEYVPVEDLPISPGERGAAWALSYTENATECMVECCGDVRVWGAGPSPEECMLTVLMFCEDNEAAFKAKNGWGCSDE